MSSYQPRRSRCSVSIYLQSSPSRICHCPASPDIVFTSGPRCGLNVFDLRTQPASPVDTFMHPLASFQDCGATSSALDWSIINEGYVVSGSDNGKVCVWDALNQYKSPVVEFPPPSGDDCPSRSFSPFHHGVCLLAPLRLLSHLQQRHVGECPSMRSPSEGADVHFEARRSVSLCFCESGGAISPRHRRRKWFCLFMG